jgi:hypothetical protein
LTFHKTLAGCEEGSRAAWQGFISSYSPTIFRILSVYRPACGVECRRKAWQDCLRVLSTDNFQHLGTFDHQSEREFVVGLRAFVLETSSNRPDPAADTRDAPEPTPDAVKSLLKGLPLTHQLVLFLKLAGYSDSTLERMLRITPAVAQSSLERLQEKCVVVLQREQDAGLWPAAWMDLLRHAWASHTDACAPLRQFVRILDGQTGWNEKESVEKHAVQCLHCIERWTSLREVAHWLRETTPLPADEVEALLSGLSVKADAGANKSFLRRMFG